VNWHQTSSKTDPHRDIVIQTNRYPWGAQRNWKSWCQYYQRNSERFDLEIEKYQRNNDLIPNERSNISQVSSASRTYHRVGKENVHEGKDDLSKQQLETSQNTTVRLGKRKDVDKDIRGLEYGAKGIAPERKSTSF
jgi:hypothetical protein